MGDDVLVNKAAAIERALRRVREEYAGDDRNLLENETRQDAIILNLQRACESSIDAAMHVVRVRRLGVPQETRDAFDLLERAGVLDAHLAGRLKRMVGFRNAGAERGAQERSTITNASISRLSGASSSNIWATSRHSPRSCCGSPLSVEAVGLP